jgi:hypothetical protein
MRKHVNKQTAKRAPVKRGAHRARFPKRNRSEIGDNAIPPLEKLLHDTYARRACHL